MPLVRARPPMSCVQLSEARTRGTAQIDRRPSRRGGAVASRPAAKPLPIILVAALMLCASVWIKTRSLPQTRGRRGTQRSGFCNPPLHATLTGLSRSKFSQQDKLMSAIDSDLQSKPEARSGLDPWKIGELPPAPRPKGLGWFGAIGPGVIALGVSIGSGEFLLGPAAFVKYGLALLWVVGVAAL